MGKVKRGGGRKAGRANPTGVVEHEDAVEESSELAILQKLSSASAEERHCSCLSLATVVLEEEAALKLLEAGVVRQLGPLLMDTDQSVREAAAGALRNLSLSSNEKACEAMIAADVLTPVVALYSQAFAELKASPSAATAAAAAEANGASDTKMDAEEGSEAKASNEPLVNCVEQTLHLLLNLTEASDVALKVFNRESLLPSVIECLQPDTFPEQLVLVAAQCLVIVTECNELAASAILSTQALLEHLCSLITTQPVSQSTVYLQTMVACILSNILQYASSDVHRVLVPHIFNTLSQALLVDSNAALAQVAANIVGAKDEGQGSSTEEIQLMKNILTAQQTALEVLTNLFTFEDVEEDDEWEEVEGGAEGGMEDDDDVAVAVEDGATAQPEANVSTAPIIVTQLTLALAERQLLSSIAEKCEGVPSHIVQVLGCSSVGQSLLEKCLKVQCRALVTLQGLSTALPCKAIGGPDTVMQLWNKLFNAANQPGVSGELLEAVTGTLRTTAILLNALKAQAIPADHIQVLCQACQLPHTSADVQINVLATLNAIASSLIALPDQVEILTVLVKCFVECASRTSSVRVLSEALDGVFDVFADGGDVGDAAVSASDALSALQQLVPKLKARVRQGTKKVGRDFPVLQSAHLNLVRFLKYMATKKKAT